MLNQSTNSEPSGNYRPFTQGTLPQAGTMHVFQRVLFATDFSPASCRAFHAAVELCSLFAAKLTILHVFEYAGAVTSSDGAMLAEFPQLLEDAKQKVQKLEREATDAGVACDSSVQSGLACEAIEDFIQAQQIDLAVLGTGALRGFERLIFGSTAEALMRKATIPVLIVGPRADATALVQQERPVVFATDFHFSTVGAIGLAATISRTSDSPLHCVHVLPRALEGGSHAEVIPDILNEALQLVAAASGVTIKPTVCATTFGSEVSNAVVEYARQHNAKLIVLGVRQASLASTHGPAHIAYRIVTEASCPVLTMAFDSHFDSHIESHLVASAACVGVA